MKAAENTDDRSEDCDLRNCGEHFAIWTLHVAWGFQVASNKLLIRCTLHATTWRQWSEAGMII